MLALFNTYRLSNLSNTLYPGDRRALVLQNPIRFVKQIVSVAQRHSEAYWPDKRGEELPEDLRVEDERREPLRAGKNVLTSANAPKRMEQAERIRQREKEEEETGRKKLGPMPTPPEDMELDEDNKANVTDSKSQMLKTYNGWLHGYNGRAAVDCDDQFILASDIIDHTNDVHQLVPRLEAFEAHYERKPRRSRFDTGYSSEANIALQDDAFELFIATSKDRKRGYQSCGR